jgi:hypothetical protein
LDPMVQLSGARKLSDVAAPKRENLLDSFAY